MFRLCILSHWILRILLRIELLSFCFLTTLDKQPCMQATFRDAVTQRKWWPKILTTLFMLLVD